MHHHRTPEGRANLQPCPQMRKGAWGTECGAVIQGRIGFRLENVMCPVLERREMGLGRCLSGKRIRVWVPRTSLNGCAGLPVIPAPGTQRQEIPGTSRIARLAKSRGCRLNRDSIDKVESYGR